MNKYTLSDILSLTIQDQQQRAYRLNELREYIILKALEFYLMEYDLKDEQIKEIELLLSQNTSDSYPGIFDSKYPDVSQYYDSLEINMVSFLLLEDLKQIKSQSSSTNIQELIDLVQNFINQGNLIVYGQRDKEVFNSLVERYKMIRQNNVT